LILSKKKKQATALLNFCIGFEIVKVMLRQGGAGLSDEQREEMANREGVASGGATKIFIPCK